jgi:uncharacterized caspase-like protein
MGHRTQQQWGADMWKAVLPGAIALVTLGLSLVSGEVVKREAGQQQVFALAQTGEPDQGKPRTAVGAPTSDARELTAPAGRPVALVIGNAAYPDAGLPLAQPVNNARALADALKDKGFDVELGENLTKQAMEHAVESFKGKIEPGSPALIFFSGFGIQAGRQTYMIPVNAHIWNEGDVRRAGVGVEPLLAEIEAKGAGAKLVILDASRRNPFERRFRGLSAGLAAVNAPDETLVMYAAAPGKVVNDGEGERSPLTEELIAQMRAPGQAAAEDVFNRTRIAVSRTTQREHVPWVSSSLVEDFVFGSSDTTATTRQSAR